MKNFILKLIAFLAFSIVTYILGVIIWGSITPMLLQGNLQYKIGAYGHMNTRIKELNKAINQDILILGSSHAYRGFDPRILKAHGKTAFNLGSSSQTPQQTLILLKRHLEKTNPQLVILEVNPISISSDGVESSLDLIANDKNDHLTYKMTLSLNNIKTYNALIYASYRELFNLDESFTEPLRTEEDLYVSGGYVERNMAYYKPRQLPKEKIQFKTRQVEALKKCIEFLKSNNAAFVLVFAPITQNLYTSYTNISEFDSLMKGFGRYYNFNELLSLSDSLDFYDSHHMNQTGVQQFNAKLIEVLEIEH